MNTTQRTRRIPRAVEAVRGAAAGRRHLTLTAVIARQLDQIAPGTVRVRIVPVWTEHTGRARTWVALNSAAGPVVADRDAHRAAHGLLSRAFPGADWTRAVTYDAQTGALTVDEPTAPAELALDTDQEARQ